MSKLARSNRNGNTGRVITQPDDGDAGLSAAQVLPVIKSKKVRNAEKTANLASAASLLMGAVVIDLPVDGPERHESRK